MNEDGLWLVYLDGRRRDFSRRFIQKHRRSSENYYFISMVLNVISFAKALGSTAYQEKSSVVSQWSLSVKFLAGIPGSMTFTAESTGVSQWL